MHLRITSTKSLVCISPGPRFAIRFGARRKGTSMRSDLDDCIVHDALTSKEFVGIEQHSAIQKLGHP